MSDDKGPAGVAWDKYRDSRIDLRGTLQTEVALDAFFEGYRAGMTDGLNAGKELAKKIFGERK